MYEPYLNREKQYLKMNAELDNRFKGIDPLKIDNVETVKPRLNVFGNGTKINNQGMKSVVQVPKQKRNEINSAAATASKKVDTATTNVKANADSAVSDDKTHKLKVSRSVERKPADSTEKISLTTEANQNLTQVGPINNMENNAVTVSSTNNDTIVKKNLSSDGLIKFLKSKVTILKQELDHSQQENVKSLRAYEGSIESNKKIAAQLHQLTNENASLKDQVEKLQSTNHALETVLKEKDADLAALNKEIVFLKKQNKEINRSHSVLDRRFTKCQEDLDHTKKSLEMSQDNERQQRAVNQHQKNFFEDQIKAMSKQRTGLISAYKKQLLLMDNLKRQNLYLEQSKLLQLAEKDFMKILDWNNSQ